MTPTPETPAQHLPEPGPSGRLEGLWATHAEKVYRAAYRVTGNAADAEDAVQTVFLRLVRLPDGKLREDAGGFLHRSAVNAGLDISPVITHRFSYDQFETAFDTAESGHCGKVLLDWSEV